MKVVAAVITSILVVLYPVAIWIGLTHFSARTVSLWILAFVVPAMAIRFWRAERADFWAVLRIPLVILAIVLLGAIFDDRRFVLAMPLLINGVLLVTFALSLFADHTIIERFARIQEMRMGGSGELSEAQRAHCRQVTFAWCAFFVLNGATAAILGWIGPLSWWAAYNGGIAYALMGVMLAGEYVLRQARFRRYGSGLHDRLLSRILPPREEV